MGCGLRPLAREPGGPRRRGAVAVSWPVMRVLQAAILAVALAAALAAQTAPPAQAAPQPAGAAAEIRCPDSVARVAVLARPSGDELVAAAPCGVVVAVLKSAGAWTQVTLSSETTGWVERKYLAPSSAATGPLAFYPGIVLGVWQQPFVSVSGGSSDYTSQGFAEIVVPALGRRYTVRCTPTGFAQSFSASCPRPDLRVGGSYPVRVDIDWLYLKQPPQPGAKPQMLKFSLVAIRVLKSPAK